MNVGSVPVNRYCAAPAVKTICDLLHQSLQANALTEIREQRILFFA